MVQECIARGPDLKPSLATVGLWACSVVWSGLQRAMPADCEHRAEQKAGKWKAPHKLSLPFSGPSLGGCLWPRRPGTPQMARVETEIAPDEGSITHWT